MAIANYNAPFEGGGFGFTGKQRGLLRGAAQDNELAARLADHPQFTRRLSHLTDLQRQQLGGQLGLPDTGAGALPLTSGTQAIGTGGYGFTGTQRGLLRSGALDNGAGLPDLLKNRVGLAGRINSMSPEQRNQLAMFLHVDPKLLMAGPAAGAPGSPIQPGPDPTPPAQPPGPLPVDTTLPPGQTSTGNLLNQYSANANPAQNALSSYYQGSLSRLNALPQASYEDMFKNYQAVADREAERQAAAINESFGSRGARYSSDLLRAQGDLRNEMADKGRLAAQQFTNDLNTQRLGEVNAVGQGVQGLGALEDQKLTRAQELFIMDYLKQSAPPPLTAAAAQYAAGFGSPASVVS